jgi:hypothetical protein
MVVTQTGFFTHLFRIVYDSVAEPDYFSPNPGPDSDLYINCTQILFLIKLLIAEFSSEGKRH